jgi:hypothetical protein
MHAHQTQYKVGLLVEEHIADFLLQSVRVPTIHFIIYLENTFFMHQKGVNMYYRYLGRTGMKVSELCLGAMTFGRESSEDISRQMMDRFTAAGDTGLPNPYDYITRAAEPRR